MSRESTLLALLASLLVAGCGGSEVANAPDPSDNPVIKAASSKPSGNMSVARKVSIED